MIPGEIWLHHNFYQDETSKEWLNKYLLILAISRSGDAVFRLLTSRAHGRPENPRCYHGDPYPGFYLGIVGNSLNDKSWLDLREIEDYDSLDFKKAVASKRLKFVCSLPTQEFCLAAKCAANSPDTTLAQHKAILDHCAQRPCP